MFSRFTLMVVTLFWVTMSVLLWQSEFGGRKEPGGRVPAEVVWRKILTAPDISSLDLFHHQMKVGYCRWTANSGQDQGVRKIIADELPPEPNPGASTGYRLDLEGNLSLDNIPGRVRFDMGLGLATNELWQEFNLRFTLRRKIWLIHSLASEQSLHLRTESEEEKSEQVFKFADFQNPQALLQEFDLPPSFEFLGAMGLSPGSQKAPSLSVGLHWEAWNDWITIGHTSVRSYRLQARLLDRYSIVVIVSRVGEILRVELPEGWSLVNDQVANL
ncbi:MAG: hypothetical protein JWR26_4831 [Pedosphaera sp.]|nr:hypothetical protein [Pedosphaera sp.]